MVQASSYTLCFVFSALRGKHFLVFSSVSCAVKINNQNIIVRFSLNTYSYLSKLCQFVIVWMLSFDNCILFLAFIYPNTLTTFSFVIWKCLDILVSDKYKHLATKCKLTFIHKAIHGEQNLVLTNFCHFLSFIFLTISASLTSSKLVTYISQKISVFPP